MKVLNSDLFSAAIENKVHVNDLHATMLRLLGIDHEKLTYRHIGHAYRLTDVGGRVIHAVIVQLPSPFPETRQ